MCIDKIDKSRVRWLNHMRDQTWNFLIPGDGTHSFRWTGANAFIDEKRIKMNKIYLIILNNLIRIIKMTLGALIILVEINKVG